MKNKSGLVFILLSVIFLFGCAGKEIKVASKNIALEFDKNLFTKISSPYFVPDTVFSGFVASDYLTLKDSIIKKFKFKRSEIKSLDDKTVLIVAGDAEYQGGIITKEISAVSYKEFPDFLFTKVKYINNGKNSIKVAGWINNDYIIPQKDAAEIFWSYQSGTYEERPDWVRQVPNGFFQKNYMGMNASDYGGGTPVSDVWTKDFGLAVGHVEKVPKLVSLPVERKKNGGGVELKVEYAKERKLNPGDTLETFTTFIAVHKKDYFRTLSEYAKFMRDENGVVFDKAPNDSYEPVWCAWGYERNFTVDEILNTLPKVKELGFKWVVLDDGWQTAEGDWYLNPKKFPNGDADMKAFVDKIHSYGLKAKLWWAPLAVDPGTDLIKNYPDMILLNKEGKPQDISWWDSYYLCPAYQPTLDYTKNLVEKMMGDWGYDGLKIDGQHLNAAPPCYNPAHHHKYPEESTEAMPGFFKLIYETALSIKKNAVVEVCPCGTAYNFFLLPYVNQTVSSDPTSSWQIRLKGKTMKALMGSDAPYYGDHVELSDDKSDFASTVGVGGVIGSKFTYPPGVYLNAESGDVSLTPEKEKKWKKWIDIYERYKLPKGKYLGNLYDVGFDKPETHVIKKNDTLFYAFYSDKFNGRLEFRGLDSSKKYKAFDYVNYKELGEIDGSKPFIDTSFGKYLLVKVSPIK
ncbi:MAG: alpha-galactosidase [Chlorobi bacterium]|nr:alpha-galactosidase [Chlorobiota bacterium]